jgi:hypothetical protein
MNLPDSPTEEQCCAWWLGLGEQLLVKERMSYHRSSSSKPVGKKETKSQLDLVVENKRKLKRAASTTEETFSSSVSSRGQTKPRRPCGSSWAAPCVMYLLVNPRDDLHMHFI